VLLLTFSAVAIALPPASTRPALALTSAPLRCEQEGSGTSQVGRDAEFVPFARASAERSRDSLLVALYESGQDFATFHEQAKSRRAMWDKNWNEGRVPEDVLAQARAIGGRWRLLVVAVDGCSDSVNTVPYVARLVELVPTIEMRIVLPGPGRPVQESHRTPDGRAATPTFVLIDADGKDAGCWVERPAVLQESFIKAKAENAIDAWAGAKQGWYDADAGASTLREIVAMIAAAAGGTPTCAMAAPPATTP
jgi:hypothetical protein